MPQHVHRLPPRRLPGTIIPGISLHASNEGGQGGGGNEGDGTPGVGNGEGGDQGGIPGLGAAPVAARDVAASIADHIAGRRTLTGVPRGSEARYIQDVILNSGPQVRTRVINPATGEQIWQDGRNIVIYQPMAAEGGTAFFKPTFSSAMDYFDNFGL